MGKFNHLNDLLSDREAFVDAHKQHPAYARAVVEGQILRDLRQAEINEFDSQLNEGKVI